MLYPFIVGERLAQVNRRRSRCRGQRGKNGVDFWTAIL